MQGFKYLYLSPDDFKKVSAMNSLQAELIDDGGETRYKIQTIIGSCCPMILNFIYIIWFITGKVLYTLWDKKSAKLRQ